MMGVVKGIRLKTKTRFHHPMRKRGFTGYRPTNIGHIFLVPCIHEGLYRHLSNWRLFRQGISALVNCIMEWIYSRVKTNHALWLDYPETWICKGRNQKSCKNDIPGTNRVDIIVDDEAIKLAEIYITEGALTNKSYNDALHIALATLNNADVLASWNFKHIVNLDRIRLYNSINLRFGYRLIEIRTPREILNLTGNE